jgi:16S rRNA (cytidine1402-2'-O)-methyltransferase
MSDNLGTFYVIATPIGNLGDMTFRAVEILKTVDVILCEDTRTTGSLLKHFGIPNKNTEGRSKLASYHSHSKINKIENIKEMIRSGKNVALVSDAGTPCISDPGVVLVAELKKEFGSELTVSPLPGASALISALSVSGIPAHEFTWLGFIPHKKGRDTFFNQIRDIGHTVVFYEAVHRFPKTLESLAEYIPDRTVVIARELTKIFEQMVTGTATEVKDYFDNHPDKIRGEFVLIVGPKK